MKEREKIRYRLSVNHLSFAWLIDMLRKRGIETNGPIPPPPMFTVFMCRKCEHLLYVEEDEDFPQKLGKIAAKSCPCCGEQEEGLWRLLGRAEGFEGTVFTEESDED